MKELWVEVTVEFSSRACNFLFALVYTRTTECHYE